MAAFRYPNSAVYPTFIPITQKGQPNGVATLDENGVIPLDQLPTIGAPIEQYVIASIDPDETYTITHGSDPNNKRLVQVYLPFVGLTRTLNINDTTASQYTQQDLTKTTIDSGGFRLTLDYRDPGLLYLWLLDGDLVAEKGGVNGTASGDISFISDTGPVGNTEVLAVGTTPNTSRVDVGNIDITAATDTMTIACWVYPNALCVAPEIFVSKYSGSQFDWAFGVDFNTTQNRMFFAVTHPGPSTTTAFSSTGFNLAAGQWHFVAARYNGSNIVFWKNGAVDSITTPDTGDVIVDPTHPVSIGNTGGGGSPTTPFNGQIAQLSIWNTAVADATLLQIYSSGAQSLRTYDTTASGWYALTDSSQTDTLEWIGINSLAFTQSTPASTDVRYLISVDNKVTWNAWSGSWNPVLIGNIMTSGNTAAQLQALTDVDFGSLFVAGTLDFAVGINTSDGAATPAVSKIVVSYKATGGIIKDVTATAVIIRNATTTDIVNISESAIGPVTTNILIPA